MKPATIDRLLCGILLLIFTIGLVGVTSAQQVSSSEVRPERVGRGDVTFVELKDSLTARFASLQGLRDSVEANHLTVDGVRDSLKSGLYGEFGSVFGGAGQLASLQRAMARREITQENVSVVLIGDSNTDSKWTFHTPVRDVVEKRFPRAAPGWLQLNGDGWQPPAGITVTIGSGWFATPSGYGLGGATRIANTVGDQVSVVGSFGFSSFDAGKVAFASAPGGGTAVVEVVSEGTVVRSYAIDTDGPANTLISRSFGGGDLVYGGQNEVRIRVTDPATAGVHLVGIKLARREGAGAIQFHKLGFPGAQASDWLTALGSTLVDSVVTQADAVVVNLGTNDIRQVDSVTFETNLRALVAQIGSYGVDVLLVSPGVLDPAVTPAQNFEHATLRSIVRRVALETGSAYASLRGLHGDWAQVVADNLYRDEVHYDSGGLSDPGPSRHGAFLYEALFGVTPELEEADPQFLASHAADLTLADLTKLRNGNFEDWDYIMRDHVATRQKHWISPNGTRHRGVFLETGATTFKFGENTPPLRLVSAGEAPALQFRRADSTTVVATIGGREPSTGALLMNGLFRFSLPPTVNGFPVWASTKPLHTSVNNPGENDVIAYSNGQYRARAAYFTIGQGFQTAVFPLRATALTSQGNTFIGNENGGVAHLKMFPLSGGAVIQFRDNANATTAYFQGVTGGVKVQGGRLEVRDGLTLVGTGSASTGDYLGINASGAVVKLPTPSGGGSTFFSGSAGTTSNIQRSGNIAVVAAGDGGVQLSKGTTDRAGFLRFNHSDGSNAGFFGFHKPGDPFAFAKGTSPGFAFDGPVDLGNNALSGVLAATTANQAVNKAQLDQVASRVSGLEAGASFLYFQVEQVFGQTQLSAGVAPQTLVITPELAGMQLFVTATVNAAAAGAAIDDNELTWSKNGTAYAAIQRLGANRYTAQYDLGVVALGDVIQVAVSNLSSPAPEGLRLHYRAVNPSL